MAGNTGHELRTHKKGSVAVKEVDADDSSIEAISISHSLVEVLVKDPVCGRSDYSDLPGVSRGVCSSWRSFAEFPRRTNTPIRYQTDAPASSDHRQQKNYEAKIRREKLTLQRVAKRERLRAQQRERRRQQTFLNKLQNKTSEVANSCLSAGVIISSPKKGSAKKESPKKELLKKSSQEDHKKYTHGKKKNVKYVKKSKTLHREDVSWKPRGNSKKKINYDVNTFDEVDDVHTRKYCDDVVSTTSAHHGDVDTSQSSKTPLVSTVSSASQDKSSVLDSFGDREENPVTSSQDTQETSLKPIPSDAGIPSMSTTCIVTSTTAPEIADADSSTTSIPGRNTRNVKRVNYTEMLEDEFDQDVKQKSFRESNSGRKIRPVKRTLEKAIVEASLKKSPRKRKIEVDMNVDKSDSHPTSASSSNTEAEGDKIKQIKNATKKSAASTVHIAEKPSSFVSGHKQKHPTPKSVSADVPRHSQKQSTPKSVSADVSRHSKKQSTSKSVSGDIPQHIQKQSRPKSVPTDVPRHSKKQSTSKSVSADVPRHSKKQSTSKTVSADVPRQRQKQSTPKSVSAEIPGPCLSASTTATSKSHSLCQSNTSETLLPADSAFVSSSLSDKQHNPSNQFVSSVAPSAPPTSQPIVLSGQQQSQSTPLAHTTTIAPSSVRPPHGLQNAATQSPYNTFNSATQSSFQKPLPSMDAQDTIRYPVSSLTLSQANMQIHTSQALPAGIPSFPKDTVVYDMNDSMQPPYVLQEDKKFIPVPKRAACSVSTYQPGIRQGTASSAAAMLTNTSARASMACQTSNTQLDSAVNVEQQQQILRVQKMMADNSLTQFLKSKQMNSGGSPTIANNRIYREDAEILSCKKQSQFDVETMLNSVQKSKISGKSIGHPKKFCYNETVSSQVTHNQNLKNSNSDRIAQPAQRSVVAPRLTSQEIPGLTHKLMEVQSQSQYVTFSQSYSQQEHSLSSQTGLLQPSFESLENSQIAAIGPPPPLISASELLNSSVSVSSFGINQDTPASLAYQISSGTAPHTKHTLSPRGTLPSAPQSMLKKSPTEGDMTAQVESLMQRSVMTAKPSSASRHNVSSLHQQNMQPQPSHPALQYPDAFIVSSKGKPMQPYSGRQQEQQFRQQDQRPRMPALVSFINNPHPTDGTQEDFQTNRSLMHSFTDEPAGYSVTTQQNLTSEQKAATGIAIDQKPQVPTSQQSSYQPYKSKPNILARHRLPSARFTYRPDVTTVQQYNAHNHGKPAVINSRPPVSNPEVFTPHDAHTLHHWRPPLREGSTQYTRSQPAVGKQSLNQMLQKTTLADISQPHADLQSIQLGIYQQSPSYPKSYNNAKEQNAGTGMSHPFSIAEDQRALNQASGMLVAKMLQSSSITSPSRASGAAAQNTNLISSPQSSVQADKYAVSASQTPTKTIPSSTANIVMYAMDLSKKSSGSGPKPIKIVITTVPASVTSSSSVNPSVTTTPKSPLKKPVTMLFASPVKPTVTTTSRLPQQKPVTVPQQKPVTVHVTSSVNPSVTTAYRLPQQKPATVQVISSVNPSVTAASRLPGQKLATIPVPSSVSPPVTTISRSPGQKPATMYVTSSVNRPVTTVSSLPQGHSTTKANKAPEVACNYPLTRPQIKQEIVSQHDQSEGDTGQPNFRKSPSHMTEFTHVSTGTSFAPSRNSIPARELSNGQLSHSFGNSRDSTTVNAPQMALPVMGNNHRSIEEQIKVKVEAHLSHEHYSEQLSSSHSVASSRPLPQPALFTRALQIPVSASVTSDTAEPQLSNQLGTMRPSLAHPRVDGQRNVPPHQPMVMKEALPARIRIKHEIHSDIMENMTSVSSSNMPSTNSLMQATADSAAQNKAPDIVVNKSIVRSSNVLSALTDVSKSSLLPKQSVQSTTSTVGSVLSAVTGNVSKNHLTSTQSKLSSHTFENSPDPPPIIPRAASHTRYMNNPVNSTYGIRKNAPLPSQDSTPYAPIKTEQSSLVDSSSSSCNTSENLLANSSMCLAAVSQTVVPACSSATISEAAMSIAGEMPSSYSFPQLVNYSCDKYVSEEPVETQLSVVLPSLPSVTSPNKQPIIGASPSRLNSVLNDPLFVWHTDSNKQVSSFSLEDITNSLPLGYEQIVPGLLGDISLGNNMYTVTVSYPSNDNSNLLRCDAEAPSVDMSNIKVEPTVQPVLNQREVIDLCLSDSEENYHIDAEASSFLQTEDSVDSISQLTYPNPKDADNVKAALSVTDSKDIHLSIDNFLQTGVSETSDHYDAMSTPEKPVLGISKFAAKQIIKSPLTGHNVSVSGEHLSFIRRRLARINTDLMSFTSDIPESETSLISTNMTDRVLCDSEAPVCESKQLPLNASAAGAELHPATTETAGMSVNTSKNQGKRRLFNTLDVNTKRVSATRKHTHVEVKNEYVETISIDDDSNDEDFQQSPTTSDAQSSGICSTPGSIFSFPFGSSSAALSPQKDLSLLSSPESSVMSPSQGGGGRLASIASWTNKEVAEWLKNHKLDRVCPNLKSLDGRGLQRMAFEHQRDPDLFYTRVKKTLGLTFFQTMVICHSMKELNDSGLDDC